LIFVNFRKDTHVLIPNIEVYVSLLCYSLVSGLYLEMLKIAKGYPEGVNEKGGHVIQ
jgi:hypothetical protein